MNIAETILWFLLIMKCSDIEMLKPQIPIDGNGMAKWFGRPFGFILGIASSVLVVVASIAVVCITPLLVILIIMRLWTLFLQGGTEICIRRTMNHPDASVNGRISLFQVNDCRGRFGLPPRNRKYIYDSGDYRDQLFEEYFEKPREPYSWY